MTLCDTLGVINRGRHIVNDLNRQGTGGSLRRCAVVGYHQSDGIGGLGIGRGGIGNGGFERIGVADISTDGGARRARLVADASDAQLSLTRIDVRRRTARCEGIKLRHSEGGAANRHGCNAIGGLHGDGACGGLVCRITRAACQTFFVDGGLPRGCRAIAVIDHNVGCAIGMAVDGDGQGGRIGLAAIGERVGKHFIRERLTVVKRIDRRVALIKHIAVTAIRPNGQRAVFAYHHGTAASAGAAVGNRLGGIADDLGQFQVGNVRIGVTVHTIRGVSIRDDIAGG